MCGDIDNIEKKHDTNKHTLFFTMDKHVKQDTTNQEKFIVE